MVNAALQDVKGKQVKHHPGRALREPALCPETGSGFIMGGPFWSGALHNTEFVTQVLQSIQVWLIFV